MNTNTKFGSKLAVALCATAVAAGVTLPAVGVTTNTFYVAEGQTLTVDQVVAASNFTFEAGDWLRKTGKGQLNAVTTYQLTQINLLIEEGVYYARKQYCHNAGGKLVIKAGASVNVDATDTAPQFSGTWEVSFEGNGTGEGNNLGAICIGGERKSQILGSGITSFTMTDDATIYSYGKMNAVFSGETASLGPALNMNGYTLTILGKDSDSVFRPRWKWSVVGTPGPIVVRNGMFARQDTTNDFSSNIPLVAFLDGAAMDTYGTSSIWGKVEAFEFEAGTMIKKGADGQTGVALTMKKATGPVAISSDATVTISQEFGVRGTDVANGDKLTSANALTFSDGCKMTITNWLGIASTPGTTYTVATSTVGIVGTPALTGDAAIAFAVTNTGTALTLTVKRSIGSVIDVVNDWGLQTGAGNAAANTAAVAAHVGDVTDNAVIYFPSGEYWFTDTFDLSSVTTTGVAVWNPDKSAVLHSGVSLGAATDMMVSGFVFKECAGPAVTANGTAGLVVNDISIDNVVGTYTGGHYPFALVNVTGFNLTDCSWTAATAVWDGQAYFDGGTQSDLSEAYAGAVVAHVPSGTASWSDVTNGLKLATAAYSGKALRKTGQGTLYPDNTLAALGIASVEVLEGRYVAQADAQLGVAKGPVHVWNGACLTLAAHLAAQNRTVTVSGAGIGAEYPAVRFGTNYWDQTSYVTWELEGDTTMYAATAGMNGTFLYGTIYMNGHNLSLNGVTDGNFRFGHTFKWWGGGTVTVSNATLSANATSIANGFQIMDELTPKFFFTNGAKFVPDSAAICNIVKDCDFASGTQIAPASATTLTFRNLSGAPTGTANATAVTVSEKYTARSADVVAGTYATFAGALAFGANATVELDDPTIPRGTYTLFTAAGGIATKPDTTGETKAAGWRVIRCDANTLCIGHAPGTIIVVR